MPSANEEFWVCAMWTATNKVQKGKVNIIEYGEGERDCFGKATSCYCCNSYSVLFRYRTGDCNLCPILLTAVLGFLLRRCICTALYIWSTVVHHKLIGFVELTVQSLNLTRLSISHYKYECGQTAIKSVHNGIKPVIVVSQSQKYQQLNHRNHRTCRKFIVIFYVTLPHVISYKSRAGNLPYCSSCCLRWLLMTGKMWTGTHVPDHKLTAIWWRCKQSVEPNI